MGRLLDEDDVIDAINKRINVLQKHPEFRRKNADIDLYGIKPMIAELPSAQPEYEPVTLEDFARTMSGITVWGFAAWQGWALALIKEQGVCSMQRDEVISKQAAIRWIKAECNPYGKPTLDYETSCRIMEHLDKMPSTEQEIIRCRDCKWWRQQTNYQGSPLSFGFCESDDMWRSLYGETYEVSHIDTDDDFYCGYAERRGDSK